MRNIENERRYNVFRACCLNSFSLAGNIFDEFYGSLRALPNSPAHGRLRHAEALILRFAKVHCKNVPNGRAKRYLGNRLLILVVVLMFAVVLLPVSAAAAEGSKESKWAGVDEAVIEKIAKEHGREAREPLIGDDQGDIMLFLFLLAGAVGGFAAGYYWRILIEERRQKDETRESVAGSPEGRIPAEKRE